jgi:hypothetical protein
LSIPLLDNKVCTVETDAAPEFDLHGAISLSFDPPVLELVSKSALSNGSVRFRVRTTPGATAGQEGLLIARLALPKEGSMVTVLPFSVLPAIERPRRIAAGMVPPFEIIGVDPARDAETFATVWPELADAPAEVQNARAAYRTLRVGDGIHVLYNLAFTPYTDRLRTLRPSLVPFYRRAYEIWVAYHGITLETAEKPASVDPETLDACHASERVRVATVEAKQAAYLAELEARSKVLSVGDAA